MFYELLHVLSCMAAGGLPNYPIHHFLPFITFYVLFYDGIYLIESRDIHVQNILIQTNVSAQLKVSSPEHKVNLKSLQ